MKGTIVLVAPGTTDAEFFVVTTSGTISPGSTSITIERMSSTAATLLLDLANTSSTSAGDALIGVKRTESDAVAQTVHVWIQKSSLRATDFTGVDNTGSTDSTTGLLNAITAAKASGKALLFPNGSYKTTALLPFGGQAGMRYWGEGQVVIYNTTTVAGSIVSIDSGGDTSRVDDIEMINFILGGYSGVDYALDIRGLHRSRVHNIRAFNVFTTGIRMRYAVLNNFADLKCTQSVDTFTTTPTKGIFIGQTSSASFASSANVFTNTIIENPISGIGIDVDSGALNVFVGGTCESVPKGMVLRAGAISSSIIGMDFEDNSVIDAYVFGKSCAFRDVNASSDGSDGASIWVLSGAEGTSFSGGYVAATKIDLSTKGTSFSGVSMSNSASYGIKAGAGGLGPYKAFACPLVDTSRAETAQLLSGSATYNPSSLADGAGETTTVTVTGAALGDYASAAFSLDLQGITLTAWVSASNTVSVRFQNESGGVLDLASGTLVARVDKA